MISRSENEILLEMIEQANDLKLIATSEDEMERLKTERVLTNQYMLDLDVHAYILAGIESQIEEIYNNMDIRLATGENLDRWGYFLNVERIMSAPSYLNVNVTIPIAENENIVIPQGTRVIFEEIFQNNTNYVTSQEYIINAGATSAVLRVESEDYGYHPKIPVGVVAGLENYPSLQVTNDEESTEGRNIEEDAEFRTRLKKALTINTRGTRDCVENYLLNLDFIDSFELIPAYDGVGTLKIVCDTSPTNLDVIREGVLDNCLLVSDLPPVVELPSTVTLTSLTVYIYKGSGANSITEDELKQIVAQQCKVFVEGGYTRAGIAYKGLSIGENFNPSELISYLTEQFIEVSNFRLSQQEVVITNPDSIMKIESINVVFE